MKRQSVLGKQGSTPKVPELYAKTKSSSVSKLAGNPIQWADKEAIPKIRGRRKTNKNFPVHLLETLYRRLPVSTLTYI